MAHLNVTLNHFAAIERWTRETGGEAVLDMRAFTVEVKHRGRYYRMYPMFQGRVNGRLVHLPHLTPDVRGFGGWRPYQTLTHSHSDDKQLFKSYLGECGLRSPGASAFDSDPPAYDYVLKARTGSFGSGLFGPYRGGTPPRASATEMEPHGPMFTEQFIAGRMLKVWFWGAKPFFAHMQDYPTILGDGRSTVAELLQRKMEAVRMDWGTLEQKALVLDCLAFQGAQLADTLPEGRSAWFDFRYSQLYEASNPGTTASDNQLQPLLQRTGDQAEQLGEALAGLLRQRIAVPLMITVDGLLDDEGRIWWLEMNTNSLMPPEGYATMFADLFG